MVVKGQSAIWRDGAEPTTEVGTEDVIQFMDNAVVNVGGYIVNTRFIMNSAIALNENPGEQVDPLQDTGFEGLTVIITGSIEDPEGIGKTMAHRLKRWMLESKRVTSTFPKGRFGLRLNDFEVFNLTPGTDRGYLLENVEFGREGETKGKITFIATLRFNGSVGSLTGSEFVW